MTKKILLKDGQFWLQLKQLPYNCALFIKGDVYGKLCALNPPIQKQSMNIPKVSDLTTIASPKEGDLVFHIQSRSLMIYTGSGWKSCQVSSLA